MGFGLGRLEMGVHPICKRLGPNPPLRCSAVLFGRWNSSLCRPKRD
jgi:hypothetical protein